MYCISDCSFHLSGGERVFLTSYSDIVLSAMERAFCEMFEKILVDKNCVISLSPSGKTMLQVIYNKESKERREKFLRNVQNLMRLVSLYREHRIEQGLPSYARDDPIIIKNIDVGFFLLG